MKKSRLWSFVTIAIIYVLATVLGIVVYNLLPFDTWLSLLIADVSATIFVFVFSVVLGNASVYDPYWSVQPMVIVVAFAWNRPFNVPTLLLLIAIIGWGTRLTANWAYTFTNLTVQDWRYTMLREKTGKWYPVINFVGIHLVPTLVVYGCTLPAVYVITNNVNFNAWQLVFTLVSVGAFVMQGIADVQMHKYRRNRTTPFIRTGLWKYSRHPNYLGELLMWWGIALGSICVLPQMWYLIAGAISNTLLFVFVSVPMADNRQSRKQGWKEYKSQTHVFLPIKK